MKSLPHSGEDSLRIKNGDINHLWIWKRRPSCAIRYDHGGYNASFPINEHTVLAQIFFAQERKREEALKRKLNPYPRRPNILQFPARRPLPDLPG